METFTDTFKIDNFRGTVKRNEPMAAHTTMRVGGTAPLFIEPSDEESLARAVGALAAGGRRFFVLGGGSNTILPDTIPFAILSTRLLCAEPQFRAQEDGNGTLSLAAGLSWARVCAFCRENAIPTFAPFSGLPGTVGGAVFMNATCFGFSACDTLVRVRYLDTDTMRVREYEKDANDFSYKKSPFQGGGKIIVSADFAVARCESSRDELDGLYKAALSERVAKKHFSAPSAGSVFKNDGGKGVIAGKIIDECGLKGASVGGAKVSDWHGNFIVNTGKASAKDVHDLVNFIKSEVKKKKNIELECEILFAE